MPSGWIWAPTDTPPKCKLSKWQKQSLLAQADKLVNEFYKPTFIKPPAKDQHFNHLVDCSTKWHGAYLYFIAKYAGPGPNALSPFFRSRLRPTRLFRT